MSDIEGKVALVTGGGRGIGRAAALELARRGALVAVAARSKPELDTVAAEIQQAGGTAVALTVDLADREATQRLVEQVSAALGPIAVLVNNAAAVGPFGLSWELDAQAWERSLSINLVAPFHLSHAVLPSMLEQGWGRIINVSSGAARNPLERSGPYSVSKAGLDMLTRQLGLELEGSGVAAICVYPGVVDTVMQTAIREQPVSVVGERVAERFQGFYTSGQLLDANRPGRLIATLADTGGAEFNGQIVDVYGDDAQRLVSQEQS
jgi:NAD(P)-dependent dehydrogenase (short-subunit alcohol dehydrogenase family)